MEWKTLILGIGISIGVFGIKAGAGLYGGLSDRSDGGRGRNLLFYFAAGYALVFALLAAGLSLIHLKAPNDAWMQWLRSGMLVHVVLASFMLVWGVILKRSKMCCTNRRNGWWLLAVPCPVCMTVIGISLAFLMALFPGAVMKSAVLLYFGFMGIVLSTVWVLLRLERRLRLRPEEILASAMLILSAYFLLSILIMPQFAGIEEVSRLGERSLQTTQISNDLRGLGMGLVVTAIFGVGYVWTTWRRRSAVSSLASDEKRYRIGLLAAFRRLPVLIPLLKLDGRAPNDLSNETVNIWKP